MHPHGPPRGRGICVMSVRIPPHALPTTSFIAFGTLTWDYALVLFCLGLVTTAVGQVGVSFLVKKYKRSSLVALSIAAVVGLSTVLMALHGVMALADDSVASSSSSIC